MIEKDRVLLARLCKVNQNLGSVVLQLCAHQDGGELPADGLRVLGVELSNLGGDMVARADELDCLVIDADGSAEYGLPER